MSLVAIYARRIAVAAFVVLSSIVTVAEEVPDGTDAYYRGDYAAALASFNLEHEKVREGSDGLQLYRVFFALRMTDSKPTAVAKARSEAMTVLRRELETNPQPSTAYYLRVLNFGAFPADPRLDAWLDLPASTWSIFEATKLLQLTQSANDSVKRSAPLVVRLLEDPELWTAPFLEEVVRAIAERPDRELHRALLERKITPWQSNLAVRLTWAEYLFLSGREDDARLQLRRIETASQGAGSQTCSVRLRWAALLQSMGRSEDALPMLSRLAEQENRSYLWRELAELQLALGQYALADVSYRRGIALNPTDSLLRLGIARSLLDQGKIDEAEREYRLAVELGDDSDRARFSLSLFLEREGKYREALAIADSLSSEPRSTDRLLRLRARLLWRLGDYDKVLNLTDSAAADAADAALWHIRALAFRDRGAEGDVVRALAALEEAVGAAPDERAYRIERVEFLWLAAQVDRAIEQQRVLLGENGNDLQGWQRLGRMLVSDPERLDEAAQAYRNALDFFPDDPEIWQKLMQTLSLLRRQEQQIRS